MKKTHSEKIREAVTDLGPASPNEIMDWIRKHYPNDEVNPQSYRADIIGCSQNHSSQHHYPSMPKFLWFEEDTKKYSLASPEESAKAETIEERFQPDFDLAQELVDGVAVAKMSITGQVAIPAVIRKKLGFKPGDLLAFVINNNILEVRKAKLKIEFE